MSHHIYTTQGFVLGSAPLGESSLYISVFTKDLGLVGASARSVREIKSKLRYGLQDFCLSSVSFVRGKREWKITSAVPQKNIQHLFSVRNDAFLVCAHALSLIKKLVTGEEKNEALFEIVYSGFEFLEKNDLTPQELLNFECIMMLRIVGNLGYLSPVEALKFFADSSHWDRDLLASMTPHQRSAVGEINKSIRESQL